MSPESRLVDHDGRDVVLVLERRQLVEGLGGLGAGRQPGGRLVVLDVGELAGEAAGDDHDDDPEGEHDPLGDAAGELAGDLSMHGTPVNRRPPTVVIGVYPEIRGCCRIVIV